MTPRFQTRCRRLLAGVLTLGGAVAVSVVGGPLTATTATASTPAGWTAYVVSFADDAVIPVDTATHAVGAAIAVGSAPSAIAITPDGSTAYVTDEGTTTTTPGFVTPIALSTNTPGAPIPVGSGPDAIAITPDGRTAYVGNYNDDTVTPVDLVTDAAGTPIPVGAPPTAITISPDGSTAYVTQGFAADVIPINTATNTAAAGILNTNDGYASAITPDGSTLYTAAASTNGVATLDTTTAARGSVAALDSPRGVAITPDGSTAYVAYSPFTTNKGALLPIPVADPGSPGAAINLGTGSAFAVAITPDGSTAFVTDLTGGNLVPVDLASRTAGAPIPLGVNGAEPFAVAIAPDQAPIAHMHVTALGGGTMSFDASASTVAHGTITSYAWNFGDGSTETTTAPTVNHTYSNTALGQVASVTETDSVGTSTGQVFTGQTVSRNGSPQATDQATLYFTPADAAVEYPTVTAVSPGAGPTAGPTTVTVTGTGFRPGQTEVYVGGVAATNVAVASSQLSLTATLPAQPAGVYDIIVKTATTPYYFGSSAATPADRFTYAPALPLVVTSCTSSACVIPPIQYGTTTVAATVSAGCTACTYSASVAQGVPATASTAGICPVGMSYAQPLASVNEAQIGASAQSVLSVALIGVNQGASSPPTTVCADVTALTGAAPVGTPLSAPDAATAPVVGQDVLLLKCAKKAVAPCVRSVVVNGTSVTTTVLVPVNEAVTLSAGPQLDTIKRLAPKKGGAPGSDLTITGTNLGQVTAVYLDGVPVGGQLLGGLPTSIVSETAKKLVVVVPPGAATGPVTLVGPSGDVTSNSLFTVT